MSPKLGGMTQERFGVPPGGKTASARGTGSIVWASYDFILKIITLKSLHFNISIHLSKPWCLNLAF